MNRAQRRKRGRDRQFRVDVVPRQTPDLHKLAQVFLGMAVARAGAAQPSRGVEDRATHPESEKTGEVE